MRAKVLTIFVKVKCQFKRKKTKIDIIYICYNERVKFFSQKVN